MAKKAAYKNPILKGADSLKVQVKNLHNEALETSDTLVEEALVTGEQWQKIFAKAMKSGTVLFGKQQDLLFDTLETLKEQSIVGGSRLGKLLSLNWRKPTELKTRINSTRKKATAKMEKAMAPIKKAKSVKTRVAKAQKKVVKAQKAVVANDLTKIEGIGPKIAEHLNKAGISSFAQLAAADIKSIKTILTAAGPRYARRNPSTWAQQAKLAATGKWDRLKTLQSKLKGGLRAKK